jgi:N-acetylmuramoyl-L-alanine amidase
VFRRLALAISICVAVVATAAAGPSPPANVAVASSAASKPKIDWRSIPFDAKRRRETKRYAERHYGISTWRLDDPQVIVEHMSQTDSLDAIYNTFAPDRPDPEAGELPGLCSHFAVGEDGKIEQFVRTGIICRHTAGLNYTAIGIEHAGDVAPQVLGNRAQLRASLHLTQWLRCRFGIKIRNVIGHNESLDSPFYVEHVDSFKGITHDDWPERYMDAYRHKLRRLGGCS